MDYQPLGPDMFYPSGKDELNESIASSLKHARESLPELPEGLRVLVIPHGWYEYIQPVLASAWAAASRNPCSRIVLLLPVHTPEPETRHGLYIPPLKQLSCPLGECPVEFPEGTGSIKRDSRYFLEEPALDNPLPFIMHAFPGVPVLPLFVPGNTSQHAESLAAFLQQTDTPETLYVISSNMSSLLPVEKGCGHSQRLCSLLGSPDNRKAHLPLLEPWKKGEISPCNPVSLEALRRTAMLSGPYHVLGLTRSAGQGGKTVFYGALIG